MKIYLVDDNVKFRKDLKFFLEGHLHHEVIGEATDAIDFKRNIHYIADIVLMKFQKNILINTISTNYCFKSIREGNVIALSQNNEMVDFRVLQNVGFKGFVSKRNLYRDLETAINTVASGNLFYPNKN